MNKFAAKRLIVEKISIFNTFQKYWTKFRIICQKEVK